MAVVDGVERARVNAYFFHVDGTTKLQVGNLHRVVIEEFRDHL